MRIGAERSLYPVKDLVGNPTGEAFIEYYLPDHAAQVLEAHEGITVDGLNIDVTLFKRSLTTVKPSRTLHASQLPKDTTLSEIKTLFEQFGPVHNVRFGELDPSIISMLVSRYIRALSWVGVHRLHDNER